VGDERTRKKEQFDRIAPCLQSNDKTMMYFACLYFLVTHLTIFYKIIGLPRF
jgi:hypothetical protein